MNKKKLSSLGLGLSLTIAAFLFYDKTDNNLVKNDGARSVLNENYDDKRYYSRNKNTVVFSHPVLNNHKDSLGSLMNVKKYNKRLAEKLWKEIIVKKNKSDELKKLLLDFRGYGAGWVLYEDIAQKITSNYFDDSTISYLLKIIVDAYEGGSIDDKTYHFPLNQKDEIIQNILRDQLVNPSGKDSLKYTMELLYYLEQGDNIELLEETIKNHPSLLTKIEKLNYRLHYSSFDLDNLSKVISDLDAESDDVDYIISVQNTIFEYLNSSLLIEDNGLLVNVNLQNSLSEYLDNNKIEMFDYNKLSYDEQDDLSSRYASWVWATGAVNGEKNLDDFLYQTAQDQVDPVKLLSLINYQRNRIEIKGGTREVKRLINNSYVKDTLQSALLSPDLDELSRNQIERIAINYYGKKEEEPRSIEETISNMTEKQKEAMKLQLKQSLNRKSLSVEDRLKIKDILDSYF